MITVGLTAFALLSICTLALLLVMFLPARRHVLTISREVLAFHYGWWDTGVQSGISRHWGEIDASGRQFDNTAHWPTGGSYDSQDEAVVDRQLAQMKTCGITGIVSSWWGQDSFEDKTLALLCAQASRYSLTVSAYYETIRPDAVGLDVDAMVDAVVSDIIFLLEHRVPSAPWLRVAGSPVLFIYGRAIDQLGIIGWRRVGDRLEHRTDTPILIGDLSTGTGIGEATLAFSGVHIYNDSRASAGLDAAGLSRWAKRVYRRRLASWSGFIRCMTVSPGFDDRRASRNSSAAGVTNRNNGGTLTALGNAAVDAGPEWLLVTSWNEWHEGTEIEPSREHGDQAIRDLRVIAQRFRDLPPSRVALRFPERRWRLGPGRPPPA